jgi:hypothetical protein
MVIVTNRLEKNQGPDQDAGETVCAQTEGIVRMAEKRDLDKTYKDTWIRRSRNLNAMGIKTYEEFLASHYWVSIKEKARTRAHFRVCKGCGSQNGIELHHKSYKWIGTKNELLAVIPLCGNCHKAIHEVAKHLSVAVRLPGKKARTAIRKRIEARRVPDDATARQAIGITVGTVSGGVSRANCAKYGIESPLSAGWASRLESRIESFVEIGMTVAAAMSHIQADAVLSRRLIRHVPLSPAPS